MSGLLMRSRSSLAMIISAYLVSHCSARSRRWSGFGMAGLWFAGGSSPHFALPNVTAVLRRISFDSLPLCSCDPSFQTEEFVRCHDRPRDTGQLIGERDGDEPRRPTLQ
jgi:hypothetical protein